MKDLTRYSEVALLWPR